MVETLRPKKENRIKKLEKIAETRMAVHTHTHTLYCHLENKKIITFKRDRAGPLL